MLIKRAVQLEKIWGKYFIVEMICITMFREIVPLVTLYCNSWAVLAHTLLKLEL